MTIRNFHELLQAFPNLLTANHVPGPAMFPCILLMETLGAALLLGNRAFAVDVPPFLDHLKKLKANQAQQYDSLAHSVSFWVFLYQQDMLGLEQNSDEKSLMIIRIEAIPVNSDYISDWLFAIIFRPEIFGDEIIDAAKQKLIAFYAHQTRDASYTA